MQGKIGFTSTTMPTKYLIVSFPHLVVRRVDVRAEGLSVEVWVGLLLDDLRVELCEDLLGALAQRPPVPPQAHPHEGVARRAVVARREVAGVLREFAFNDYVTFDEVCKHA